MSVSSLDSKIREKAYRELQDKLGKALTEAKKAFSPPYGKGESVLFKKDGHKSANIHTLLEEVYSVTLSGLKAQVEEEAVKAFLLKVDSLQEQIEELQNL